MAGEPDAENVITILVASDLHLGYMEKDAVRGNDTIVSFEEILEIATERQVDMVLLGGDMFHENKPSRKILYQTMELIRKYCMGDRPCALDFLSDPAVNFPSRFGNVNYEDPNFNVSMPIFSIHGNHDDPSGAGGYAALDLLSVSNMVNYFGKASAVDSIEISPILLQKGRAKLALYGLGAIRDERLHRTFLDGKVKLLEPAEDAENWFHLFVLHQNRVKHGPTNYIPESFLPDVLDLVVWGHEHKSEIPPKKCDVRNLFITQPGSPVATSLCEAEAVPKAVGILSVSEDKRFKMEAVELKKTRPFYYDEIVLSEEAVEPHRPDDVEKLLVNKVREMLRRAKRDHEDRYKNAADIPEALLPLIRLKVEYSGGFSAINVQRFGGRFVSEVANPRELLNFYRKRAAHRPTAAGGAGDADEAGEAEEADRGGAAGRRDMSAAAVSARVEDLIASNLRQQELQILPQKSLGEAVRSFVDKEEKDAIKELVAYVLKRTQENLQKRVQPSANETDIAREVADQREHDVQLPTRARRAASPVRKTGKTSRAKAAPKGKRKARGAAASDDDDEEEEEEAEEEDDEEEHFSAQSQSSEPPSDEEAEVQRRAKGKQKAAPKKKPAAKAPAKAKVAAPAKSRAKAPTRAPAQGSKARGKGAVAAAAAAAAVSPAASPGKGVHDDPIEIVDSGDDSPPHRARKSTVKRDQEDGDFNPIARKGKSAATAATKRRKP
eukprot:m.202966 g.202966  ORF g.202966 m.202966 type:complete len:723 (-) comp21968_c0_seq5:183-2351(-)